MTTQEIIEKATDWMEDTAKDSKHGYDQIYRWGQKGDYDCSAAVITAWNKAGVDLKADGATYTGNLVQALLKNNFKDITSEVDVRNGKGLKRGDVLFAKGHHVAMYCGGGLEVEASINEKGKATGGKPGDQTGKEFLIRKYRNYPWTNAFRYVGDNNEEDSGKDKEVLRKTEEKITYKVTASSGLNVRKAPNLSATIVGVAKHDTILIYDTSVKDKKDDNWTPVIYKDNIHGFVSNKYIKRV